MFTSTTAPGKTFETRGELAEHYKSDWHKYNLKRREAGLAMLQEADFTARWEAALALRKEKEAKAKMGTDHLKNKLTKKNKQTQSKKKAAKEVESENSSSKMDVESTDKADEPVGKRMPESLVKSQENPDINPKQSLFDKHVSETVEQNLQYMQQKYGFFLPDQECLVDLEGLLGYCQEKIKLGHYCLYCNKMFPTWQGCQNHMISSQHCKLRYEQGYWDELDPFYNFGRDNAKYTGDQRGKEDPKMDVDDDAMVDDGDDEGWEDISEDEDEDEVYQGYEREIARFGLDVTPLGELVFPDGRIIGHRALNRYYKQNYRPANTSTAIVAAKQAAGERLYEGRVVNIGGPISKEQLKGSGKGILVAMKDGVEGFSALSLYRYRAAVRKQRRDDDKGRRLQYRTTQNINRMDKKANRLMNGVSVAHAAR